MERPNLWKSHSVLLEIPPDAYWRRSALWWPSLLSACGSFWACQTSRSSKKERFECTFLYPLHDWPERYVPLRDRWNASSECFSAPSAVINDLGMPTALYGLSTHQFMSNVTKGKGALPKDSLLSTMIFSYWQCVVQNIQPNSSALLPADLPHSLDTVDATQNEKGRHRIGIVDFDVDLPLRPLAEALDRVLGSWN